MKRSIPIRLPVKPVPFQKPGKLASKRHPPWSWRDSKLDFQFHKTAGEANRYLWRKTWLMRDEDKPFMGCYVDWEKVEGRPRTPIDIIGIYGPDWISVSHISYFGQVPSRLKSILFDPSYLMWVGHPEHVRNLQEDFGLPEDRPWRDLLVTATTLLPNLPSSLMGRLTSGERTEGLMALLEKKECSKELFIRNSHDWTKKQASQHDMDQVGDILSAQHRILQHIKPEIIKLLIQAAEKKAKDAEKAGRA